MRTHLLAQLLNVWARIEEHHLQLSAIHENKSLGVDVTNVVLVVLSCGHKVISHGTHVARCGQCGE